MRKGQYWLNQLTTEEQINYKKNKDNTNLGFSFEEIIKRDYGSLLAFLSASFSWGTTKEGFSYWSKISDRNEKIQ